MSAATLRSKVTSFIAKNNSPQEFMPVIGRLIDLAHVDPLHIKNNVCAHTHQLLLRKVVAMSRLGDATKTFSCSHKLAIQEVYPQSVQLSFDQVSQQANAMV